MEHHLDPVNGDAPQVDFGARIGWRGRGRRRRRGPFVGPDMRWYRWLVSVRVADLRDRDGG